MLFCFFFFKQKTAYEMRISDWSSDVCSSDLGTLSPPDNYMIPKSIIDRLAAAVALVILAPFLAVIAILVRFDSSGPAIFRQERIGYRGKPFIVYKFRTMRTRTDRKRAVYGKSVSERVDLGGRRTIKKK